MAGTYQRTQQGLLAHDLRIGAGIGGRGCVAYQCRQVGQAADVGELAATFKAFGYGDHIGRLRLRHEFRDGVEYQPVVGAIEIFRTHAVANLIPGLGVEQEPAQHGLLGFNGVWGSL